MGRFRKFQHGSSHFHPNQPFQHWYRDNTVYFITATCREHFPAFQSEQAKAIFWDRFFHWTRDAGFVVWVVTLMNNHYHVLGYIKDASKLGRMMQRIHGSVAKLVNDVLPERRLKFWVYKGRADYFDGCLRDELQCRRAYRYIQRQSVRHRVEKDWTRYPHTKALIDLDKGVKRALELNAFMPGVRYRRYER